MKQQRGITLGGMFFFMILVGFGAYAAARVLPGYLDYWTIQRIMNNVLEQPDIKDAKDGKENAIRAKFVKNLQINNIKTVTGEDLLVELVPNGAHLSVSFSIKQPFMGPVNLCLDFQAEATSK